MVSVPDLAAGDIHPRPPRGDGLSGVADLPLPFVGGVDVNQIAFSNIGVLPFVILNLFQDNAMNAHDFLKHPAMVVCYPETSSG